MGRRTKIVGIVGAVVLAAGGGGLWWYLADDAPPPPELGSDCATTVDAGATPAAEWVVQPGDDVFVAYRVDELFGGDTLKRTVVGRTPGVTGRLVLDGGAVTEAEITADVSQLASDQGRRDEFLRSNALETDTFPEATFVLSEPIEVGEVSAGTRLEVEAVGELTAHGVTNPVTFALEGCWTGDTIELVGSTPVTFADYDIAIANLGFVEVDEAGSLELDLTFVPA